MELEQSLKDDAMLQLLWVWARQAEDEEIPDDGGVASFPHVFLYALNLHLKHETVQTCSVPV